MELLERTLRDHGYDVTAPAAANFLFVRAADAKAVDEALLREGVIARFMGPFGAPDALRITAGTPDELAVLAEALDALPRPSG
jgi:histidinol-phosphate/aromatic aminotransferase/cobyric acid decarboxylase-like protein